MKKENARCCDTFLKDATKMILFGIVAFGIIYGVVSLFLPFDKIPLKSLVFSEIGLLAYDLIATYVRSMISRKAPKYLTGFYLLSKVIRLCFAVIIVLAYLLLGGTSSMVFVFGFLAFYLMTLVYTTICFVKKEKKISHE